MGDELGGELAQPNRGRDFITDHQLALVSPDRNLFVAACPGSGKTRAAGFRAVRLIAERRRVALTSYTNVGIEQLQTVIQDDLSTVIPPSCFIGTLHAFLLRYVFYPFGHLVMGCADRPRLIMSEQAWPDVVFPGTQGRVRCPVPRFQFTRQGGLVFRGELPKGIATRQDAVEQGRQQARFIKAQSASKGWASADDSMYWSLQVLQKFPDICDAVAQRFDELLIDEAQDTSELQMACVREIVGSGSLRSLVLIGDEHQSIYSFQGASPISSRELATHANLEHVELTENHRASQRVCNVVASFRSIGTVDLAVGPDAGCELQPELMRYDPNSPSEAIARFVERLEAMGIPTEGVAVLARSNDLVDSLNRGGASIDVSRRVSALGRAVVVEGSARTLSRREIEALERVVAYTAWNIFDLGELDQEQRRQLREASARLMGLLPVPSMPLPDWIAAGRTALASVVSALTGSPAHKPGNVLRTPTAAGQVTAMDVFGARVSALRAQTVHDVKGETRDAVLLVADRGRGRRQAEAMTWTKALRGESLTEDEAEEIRIVFVGLTRARRYCALAVPDGTDPAAIAALRKAGFVLTQPQTLTDEPTRDSTAIQLRF